VKTTCVSTFNVDKVVTPLSVGKYNRFLIDRRFNCMRQMGSKVAILAHIGLPMKALKTARRPPENFAPNGGRAVLADPGLAGQHAFHGTRGAVSAIEQDEVIWNKWNERHNRFV
jgi:hypothetical protein